MLDDEGISAAIRDMPETMSWGIMKRCLDYVDQYKLGRLARTRDEQAVAALYMFSTETTLPEYRALGAAVRHYATTQGINFSFAKIDLRLARGPDGINTFTL